MIGTIIGVKLMEPYGSASLSSARAAANAGRYPSSSGLQGTLAGGSRTGGAGETMVVNPDLACPQLPVIETADVIRGAVVHREIEHLVEVTVE